ncbi:MAG: DUF4215 domain-containing protein [Spirochaetia bacterium]|nr:DUF4215 domain-containing protein [Spirochaetia bacterium]
MKNITKTIKILPAILLLAMFCSQENIPRDNELDPKAENFTGFGDTTAPSSPSSVSTSATGATQVTLAWQPAVDETDATSEITYQICMSETTGGCDSFAATYTTNAGETSYTITGLTPETTYYFVVLAEDSAGNISTVTEEFSVTTSAGTISLTCGDSITDMGEDCDSGKIQTSECEANCKLPECGDGIKNEGAGEFCDSGGVNVSTCDSDCTLPSCGDGIFNADAENCDDGNADNTDACLNNCTTASCGDGYIQTGVEDCDDTNTDNTDACLNDCTAASCGDGHIQAGIEECDDGNSVDNDNCTNACTTPICGDAIVQTGEECDDGNNIDNDDCTNACTTPACGDNIVQTGETCDDGNGANNDGCSSTCQIESCGDNITQATESCDDGNTIDTDDCTNSCNNATCGDNIVWSNGTGSETCDDGNTATETCTYGATGCTICDSSCQSTAGATSFCGDTIVDSLNSETCDDGNTDQTDDCLNNCTAAVCGDGYVQAGVEACDDGNSDQTDDCLNNCEAATCGDGYVQAGVETCDDGNSDQTDDCLNNCEAATCGDTFIQAGIETCDDGNTNNNDGCSSTCILESCGDGTIQTGEACDDGNTSNTDDCLNTCVVASCGDGHIFNSVETCDDGNTTTETCSYGSMGCTICNSSCQSAAGATSYCGDYIEDTANGEECDSGGSQTALCEANCKAPSCGDGVKNEGAGEQCDSGGSDVLTCDSDCTLPSCGDGHTNTAAGEDCDTFGVQTGSCMANCQFPTDAEAVAFDEANLNYADFIFNGTDSESSVTFNFTLPTTGESGTVINWSSNNTSVISYSNGTATVTRPTEGDSVNVTLTASITKGGETLQKVFTVTVIHNDTTLPVLTEVTIVSSNANTSYAKTGDTITLSFTASENLSPIPNVIIAGNTATSLTGTGAGPYSATYTMTGTETQGSVSFSIDFADTVSNDGVQVTLTTNSSSVFYDNTAPVFTSLDGANTAIDGYINSYETGSALEIVSLSASGYTMAEYTSILDDSTPITCNAGQSYISSSIPAINTMPASDSVYAVCVKLTDEPGNITYGKSIQLTRDTVLPVFTSLTGTNEADDGYINASETGSLLEIVSLSASGYTTAEYTAILDDSGSITCDAGKSYINSNIPTINALPAADSDYAVCVQLTDDAGNITFGKSVQITRDIVAPNEVSGINPSQSADTASILWTDPGNSDFNHVEITWSPGGAAVQTVNKTIQSYTATSLTNGLDYTFLLQTVDLAGNVSSGVTTAITMIPLPPGGISTMPGKEEISISFLTSTGAVSYHIYYSDTPGVTKYSGTKITDVTSPHSISPLTNTTTYYFVMTAENAGGESEDSAEVSAYPYLAALKTNQTQCWDASGAEISCTNTGQDGEYQRGRNANFTGPIQYGATTDYTTTDNDTGLIWKSCHEGQSGGTCSGTGSTIAWSTANTNCSALDNLNGGAGYGGVTGWHMATLEEFETILNYNTASPISFSTNFPNSNSSTIGYWTSSLLSTLTSDAYYIRSDTGSIQTTAKATFSKYIRCAASSSYEYTPVFVDNGDGTITNKRNGLLWQKCGNGLSGTNCEIGTHIDDTWINALNYCNTLTLAGKTWRIPNINELKSILDRSKASIPMINTIFFPATVTSLYWSSSTLVNSKSSAWAIYFTNGYQSGYQKTNWAEIRCVSDDQ